jgi:acyl-CoA synthetase (NDP forming)
MTELLTAAPREELRADVRDLVFPTSVAMVGASDRTQLAADRLRQVEAGGAPVWFVNPTRETVLGERCYPTLTALPETPSTAVLLVHHSRVEAALDDAIAAGVRTVFIPGLGAESGPAGELVKERVWLAADAAGVAVLGPNCMGAATPDGVSTWIGTIPETLLAGHVSVSAQSGSIAEALLAAGPRVGFRTVLSTGGEMNRDAADFLALLADDGQTRAIGLFLESVRRPGAFEAALARAAAAGKPVVCLKVGRSQAAARTALAHTGAIVGSVRAFSAVLERYGAIEATDFQDFLETLEILGRRRPLPRGRRIACISESGGEASLVADLGEAAGLPFEPFSAEIRSALVETFPNFVNPENPLDCFGIDDDDKVYTGAARIIAELGDYDILLAQVDVSQFRGATELAWNEAIVAALGAVPAESGIFPAVSTVHSTDPPPSVVALARELDVPLLRGTGQALRALSAVAGWRPVTPPVLPARPPVIVNDLLRTGAMPEHESAAVLERFGVRFAQRARCASPVEAAAAFERMGVPRVVVKSDGPAHKQKLGGVRLGITGAYEAAAVAEELGGQVLVAEQVPAGVEVLCGMTRDPDYGPLLVVGLGGAVAEAAGLVAVALAPLDLPAARALVRRAPALAGLASEAALEALAEVVVAVGRLAVEQPSVAEVDINPVVLQPHGAVAVDALIVVG